MFQAIRGMQDILPAASAHWQQLESQIKQLSSNYAYQEIRLPVIEQTALFKRSIGDVTDIVEKEMYTFPDSKGQLLSLRPEGTASCARALIKHQELQGAGQRLWYIGPMFRRERPQKGRYRQFHQWGVEAFGVKTANIEAELISMSYRLWKNLHLDQVLVLQLNSLGNSETRQHYRAQLIDYFSRYLKDLDPEAQKRLHQNPLRLLDSKNPALQPLIQEAPTLLPYLDLESKQHFENLQTLLTNLNIPFTINPKLVRGLDYYNRTVFEWVMRDNQASQNTICAGGRYDGLVEWLGGTSTPAAGFAVGLERLLMLWTEHNTPTPSSLDIYFILVGEEAKAKGFVLAEQLRSDFPELNIAVELLGGSMSAQFKRAYALNARLALILGPDEIKSETVTAKILDASKAQYTIPWTELQTRLSLLVYF